MSCTASGGADATRRPSRHSSCLRRAPHGARHGTAASRVSLRSPAGRTGRGERLKPQQHAPLRAHTEQPRGAALCIQGTYRAYRAATKGATKAARGGAQRRGASPTCKSGPALECRVSRTSPPLQTLAPSHPLSSPRSPTGGTSLRGSHPSAAASPGRRPRTPPQAPCPKHARARTHTCIYTLPLPPPSPPLLLARVVVTCTPHRRITTAISRVADLQYAGCDPQLTTLTLATSCPGVSRTN